MTTLILACHSDQALRLLQDASDQEAEILGAMTFQENDVVLHTDASLMPKHPKAWASWNALKLSETQARCTVTYYMNLLQNLDAPEPLLVTLNCTDRIDPAKISTAKKLSSSGLHACQSGGTKAAR